MMCTAQNVSVQSMSSVLASTDDDYEQSDHRRLLALS